MARLAPIPAAVALALAAVLAPGAAAALTLVAQERQLFAEATALGAADFDSRFDEAVAPDAGPFADAVAASASVAPVSGDASASQSSTLGAQALHATGTADASGVAAAGTFGSGTFAGEAFFDVTFTTGVAQRFRLDVTLASSALAAGDGFASVELVELAAPGSPLVLFSREAEDGEALADALSATLDPGVQYRLTAVALGVALVDDLAPTGEGGASFDVAFAALPEPGATSLLALAGLAALIARVASGRRFGVKWRA